MYKITFDKARRVNVETRVDDGEGDAVEVETQTFIHGNRETTFRIKHTAQNVPPSETLSFEKLKKNFIKKLFGSSSRCDEILSKFRYRVVFL